MAEKKSFAQAARSLVVGISNRVRRSKQEMVAHCGHVQELLEGDISAFDETVKIKIPFDSKKKPYFCLDCLESTAICCSYCHRPIFPYDPVTLYLASESFVLDEYVTIFSRQPLRLVGCLHPDCLDREQDIYGVWCPNLSSCKASVVEVEKGELAFETAIAASRFYVKGRDPNTGRRK